MFDQKPEDEIGSEYVFKKLGKSVVAKYDLKEGDVLTIDNLSGRIFKQSHIPVRESNALIGKKLLKSVVKGSPIQYEFISK